MAAGPTKRGNGLWIKLLLFLSVVFGFAAFLHWVGGINFFFDRKLQASFLDSLGPWSFAGFIFLQIIQVIAAPIPGEVTGFLGGFLFGPLKGILLTTIGLTIGSIIAFQISRALGRPVVDQIIDPRIMKRFQFLLNHESAFLVFLLFLIPGFPKDYLCYISGLGRLSLLEFTLISATGRLLGTILLTFGGAFLQQKKYMELLFLAIASLLIILLALLFKAPLERWFKTFHEKTTSSVKQ